MGAVAQLSQLLAAGAGEHTDSLEISDLLMGKEANVISITLAFIAIAGFLLTWFRDQRSIRVEKSTAYLQLEMHSSAAFRYAAENGAAMAPFEPRVPPKPRPSREGKGAEITRQYYYQCLNLFEVCSNFRRKHVIDHAVYASWVAWFHEVLDQWYFRELWQEEMRDNYTLDVRGIFDLGVQIYQSHPKAGDDELRRREFYKAVSHLLGGCRAVDEWLDKLEESPEWPPTKHGRPAMVRRGGK
jgi:hypothetical protein